MRGLDWSNTSYSRLYRQDTAAWKRLKWEAQSVYVLLLRHLDRAGCLAQLPGADLDWSNRIAAALEVS